MNCRVLKNKKCQITNKYNDSHEAVDIVGSNNELDDIIAHSDGKIIFYQDGLSNMLGSIGNNSYGNSIKIDHQNGYCTLYAHMRNNLPVKPNQYVKKGETIGYMGNSGNAFGKHLHFEVWKGNKRIDPTNYLDNDLPSNKLKYGLGDIVEINGAYVSSDSKEKLRPLITIGKITKILENTHNPYLLEEGRIGWVNDNTIIAKLDNKYLSNKTYQGNSIVDALNQIKIDSSFTNRSKLAKINDINNYQGTANQNTYMLNLLKQGQLKYI